MELARPLAGGKCLLELTGLFVREAAVEKTAHEADQTVFI
jgi:hypothetical protein